MSTREKAMNLLQEMPEQAIETVYAFMQSVLTQQSRRVESAGAFGIAHKYSNPTLIESEMGAWDPDFTKLTSEERRDLEEARDEEETVSHDEINWD